MSSDAARAMWPYLADKDERHISRPVRNREADPAWSKTDNPLWGEPMQVVKDYSKVPGLIRKANR
jgi:hypothetical protein